MKGLSAISKWPDQIEYAVRIQKSENGIGLGMFANRDLKTNDVLLTESPLFVFNQQLFDLYDTQFEQFINRTKLSKLSEENREAFFTLSNAFNAYSNRSSSQSFIIDIIITNSFIF